MSETDLSTPAERVRRRSLTDEEVEQIANWTMPAWAQGDLHSRAVVLVKDVDGCIEISGPHAIEGGHHPNWSTTVLFSFGGAPTTEEEVRRAYRDAKARYLNNA